MFDHGYALLIGVSAYQHVPQLDVPFTAADVEAVEAALRDPQYCGYPPEQVAILTGTDATRAGILSQLDALAANTDERHTVVLFYSGHGHYGDDNTYYLTSHDTRLTANRNVLSGTAISQHELLARLEALKARRVLLIFNACHAGELAPTLGSAEAPSGQNLPSQTAAALLATGSGRLIITACRENQFSFVGDGPLTIFARALRAGLCSEGRQSHAGYISAFDLYTYLYEAVRNSVEQQVPAALRQRYGGMQEPELTLIKGVGPFAVALRHGAPDAVSQEASAQPQPGPAVRQLSAEECQAALQQIQSGGISFGQQNTVQVGGDVVGGDKIDIAAAQGAISGTEGPVTQRNINTGGGEYVEGTSDKRQGIFISGGSISGPMVGVNTGAFVTGYVAPQHDTSISLNRVIEQIQQHITLANQQGDDDLAEDLSAVAGLLGAAFRAQQEGKEERRLAKLREAQQSIHPIIRGHPGVVDVAHMLAQLR